LIAAVVLAAEKPLIVLVGNDFAQQFPIVSLGAGSGGIEAHVESLAFGLYALHIDFVVICPRVTRDRRKYPFRVIETASGPIAMQTNRKHAKEQFMEQARAIITNMDRRPRLIWSQNLWSADFLHSLQIPMVVGIADSGDGQILNQYNNVVYRFNSRHQRARWLKVNDLKHAWLGDYSVAIHPGFVPESFALNESPGTYVLYVGSLTAAKGIRQFRGLAELNPDRQFVLYGAGPPPADVKFLPNMKYLGALKPGEAQRLAFSKASHFFMFSHTEDAFARVVVEAMGKGTPVLASARGSLPEIIPTLAGVATNSLADINAALKVPFQRKRIYEYAKSHFSSSQEIRQLLAVLPPKAGVKRREL
jgi:glycosyltransferase involved in cell wall biosynthesis